MSLEFLLVHCPGESAVLADGGNVGWTNHMLLLAPDFYRISLASPGYAPPYYDITLGGTSAVKPCVLTFTTAAASAATVNSKRKSA